MQAFYTILGPLERLKKMEQYQKVIALGSCLIKIKFHTTRFTFDFMNSFIDQFYLFCSFLLHPTRGKNPSYYFSRSLGQLYSDWTLKRRKKYLVSAGNLVLIFRSSVCQPGTVPTELSQVQFSDLILCHVHQERILLSTWVDCSSSASESWTGQRLQ